jgi:hypothetical protein
MHTVDPGTEALEFPTDIIFACYWWLTGAREPTYRRDRRDNLFLDRTSPILSEGLLSEPCVSLTATLLRQHLESAGAPSLSPSWATGGAEATFCLTHDVDYPEIIRWIEVPRVLATRGPARFRLALDVARGNSHFWTFQEWIDLARARGTRPAFYFMARQGSLIEYALGTPDDFYDIRSKRFATLFAQLRESGCEVGLHSSYHAHRGEDQLRHERERVEAAAGVEGIGNRHHYWHLDPDDPNETLRRHEAAGLRYDSSLGLECYPGYRRAICHPFRVFHSGERRELDIVQLPPAWMDDHFDRRLAVNGITDVDAVARKLVDVARRTRGAIVVDYHSRGMNARFYPRYGPWFTRFLSERVGPEVKFLTPLEVVASYREHDARLTAGSEDRLRDEPALPIEVVSIRPLQERHVAGVAGLHSSLFGDPVQNGYSVATLGPVMLGDVFYRLNLDNDSFHCDVAVWDGRVIGFSVYSTDRSRVFRHPLLIHPARLIWSTARTLVRRPLALRALLGNLMYLFGERLPFLDGVQGWWIVAGVEPDYRTKAFEERAGGPIASRLFDRMEEGLRAAGCQSWYGVVRPDNVPINRFLQRRGAREVGMSAAQGLSMRYYVRRLDDEAGA